MSSLQWNETEYINHSREDLIFKSSSPTNNGLHSLKNKMKANEKRTLVKTANIANKHIPLNSSLIKKVFSCYMYITTLSIRFYLPFKNRKIITKYIKKKEIQDRIIYNFSYGILTVPIHLLFKR